ncbi:MAG: hypothetical protein WB781_25895 [Candidatus Sulfotelmatobacter sp.]
MHLLSLPAHRPNHAGELVPLPLGRLRGLVKARHRLAHESIAGLGNGRLVLLGGHPERRMTLDPIHPAGHTGQALGDRAQ